MELYGKKEIIQYYCIDLLWGKKLYQELRFVLVEMNGIQSILASTDLTLEPLSIIRLYSYRFRILYEPCSYTNFQMKTRTLTVFVAEKVRIKSSTPERYNDYSDTSIGRKCYIEVKTFTCIDNDYIIFHKNTHKKHQKFLALVKSFIRTF